MHCVVTFFLVLICGFHALSHGRFLKSTSSTGLLKRLHRTLRKIHVTRGGQSVDSANDSDSTVERIREEESSSAIPSPVNTTITVEYISEFNWDSIRDYHHNDSLDRNNTNTYNGSCEAFLSDPSLVCLDLVDSTTIVEESLGIETQQIEVGSIFELPLPTPVDDQQCRQHPIDDLEDMHANCQSTTNSPSPLSSSSSLATLVPGESDKSHSIMFRTMNTTKVLRLVWYYFLLYFFTVVYNVANKKVLEFLPLPATVSAVQTLIGIPLFLPLWMLKPPRHLDTIDRSSLMKIALCHGLGNLATVYALQSGTVSFTHVIKSAEPLFTAILSIVIMKSSLSTAVYLSLLPIVFGVGLASAKELSFSWFGFLAAMLSNFFYQLRMVLSKVSFNGNEENKLSASNTFRVITIFSFIQLIPIALVLEGNQIIPAFYGMISHPEGLKFTLVNLLIAGASFYFYNEVGFWILDLVHPVTHAVGNTIKRVVLVLASIVIFRNPVNNMGLIGSSIAILGSFLYALASQKK